MIEVDILGINLTPNQYYELIPAIVYLINDVAIPVNSMTSQKQRKERYFERKWMGPQSFWNYGSALENISIFLCKGNQMNFFSKMWRISLPRRLQNNDLECWSKTAGVITNDGFLECIIFVQCTVYNARRRNNSSQTML